MAKSIRFQGMAGVGYLFPFLFLFLDTTVANEASAVLLVLYVDAQFLQEW